MGGGVWEISTWTSPGGNLALFGHVTGRKKIWPIPTPFIIIGHMVLDELWPLVLKHSYALARLAAAHGYWAAHGDAFAAPRSLRGVHKHVRAWASYCDSRCSRAAYGTFAVLRGIGALRGTGYCWVPYDPVRQARSSVRATMRRTSFIFFVGSAGGRRRRGAGARNERHLAVPVQVPASSLGTRRPGCPRCR